MPPNIIEADSIKKSYDVDGRGVDVLRKIDRLSLDRGETASIIGPSGACKSTLLHILALL